jgi:hypothetical protein
MGDPYFGRNILTIENRKKKKQNKKLENRANIYQLFEEDMREFLIPLMMYNNRVAIKTHPLCLCLYDAYIFSTHISLSLSRSLSFF